MQVNISQNKEVAKISEQEFQRISKNISRQITKLKVNGKPINIETHYSWSLPELKECWKKSFNESIECWKKSFNESIGEEDLSIFAKTIVLRKWAAEQYLKNEKDLDLSVWIVKTWGGIRTGKDENLKKSIKEAFDIQKAKTGKFKFERIASWSKPLAFKNYATRAIYDMRVIYSLNWLLLKGEAKIFFPMSSGRNSLLNFLPFENLLYIKAIGHNELIEEFQNDITSRQNGAGRSHLVNKLSSRVFIDKEDAYEIYCNLLIDIARKIYGANDPVGLTKIEMTLFTIADTIIVGEVLERLQAADHMAKKSATLTCPTLQNHCHC
ncbi:MAG: hypothetical protein V4536_02710 [Pseudomonadota bacterium]